MALLCRLVLALHSPAFPLEWAACAARRRRTVVFQRVDHQPLHEHQQNSELCMDEGFLLGEEGEEW